MDPVKQFNRADDTKNVDTMRQISTALSSYYQAQSRFPQMSIFPVAGGNLSSGSTIYMRQIPARDSQYGPFYYTDDTNPSWYAIFWRKKFVDESAVETGLRDCNLQRTNCVPSGYENNHFYCLSAGEVDCSYPGGATLP